MGNKVYIYSLCDPDTEEVRYIGKTNNIKRRYNEHLKYVDRDLNNHKNNWIKKILSQNKLPLIKIIEETDINIWEEREKFWISEYDNLTNSTLGGEDGVFTEDVRKKMSLRNKGENNPMWGKKWTDEQKKKLSDQRKNKAKSEEWKNKLSEKLGYKCVIDGITYRSISHARRELGLGYRKIKKMME
jgi:hypothetical protein